jgi:predicted PurR-regulated permease PerM
MNFPPPTERQARLIWLALTGLAIALLVALVAGLVWGLGQVLRILSPVLLPIAIAGVLAYLLDPVVDLLEQRGLRRSRAIVMVFGLAVLIVGAVFGSVAPQLINETRQLVNRIPAYTERTEQRIDYWLTNPPPFIRKWVEKYSNKTGIQTPGTAAGQAAPSVSTNGRAAPVAPAGTNAPPQTSVLDSDTLNTASSWLEKALPAVGAWLFGQVGRVASWFGLLAGLALIPVYTFYFLLEKEGISSRWTDYLPVADSRFKNELVFVLKAINGYLITFFRGQVLVAMCDGILYGLGFLSIGLPYALLIGFMAMFLTMIPFLGAIVTCATALVIAFVTFGDWQHPALVLAVFGCVQGLEGLVISPRIMGGRVGLHPVTIIIAVMAGTTLLGGLLGGILAIPLTAALRVLMFRYVWKRPAREPESP